MDDDYEETLEMYYKLKRAYEKAEKKRKKKWPTRDKKCIFCKKTGGTVFLQKNGSLIAHCGNKRKCKNKIEIKLAKYNYVPDLITKTHVILEDLKQSIIQIKMDTLFEFSDGKKFDTIKKEFDEQSAILATIQKDNKQDHSELISDIYKDIETYKGTIQSYIKEQNMIQLINAINLYVNNIKPKQEALREQKYAVMDIEKIGDTFKLIQEKTGIQEILIEKGAVISTIS